MAAAEGEFSSVYISAFLPFKHLILYIAVWNPNRDNPPPVASLVMPYGNLFAACGSWRDVGAVLVQRLSREVSEGNGQLKVTKRAAEDVQRF